VTDKRSLDALMVDTQLYCLMTCPACLANKLNYRDGPSAKLRDGSISCSACGFNAVVAWTGSSTEGTKRTYRLEVLNHGG
jgi:hypothetical protein